jgi:hypothetical protein
MKELAVKVSAMGSETPIKALAVVGAATLGALLIGGLVQLIIRLGFGRNVPRWPMWGIRGMGGFLCGWLVYLWLFGGGGTGIGGAGGFGGSGGTGEKDGKVVADKDKDKQNPPKVEKKKDIDKDLPPPEGTLQIEVLGKDTLVKIGKSRAAEENKFYRIRGKGRLFTLEEIKKVILNQRVGTPPLRKLQVIVYLDSPDLSKPQVTGLVEWARDLDPTGGKVDVEQVAPERNAPVD